MTNAELQQKNQHKKIVVYSIYSFLKAQRYLKSGNQDKPG